MNVLKLLEKPGPVPTWQPTRSKGLAQSLHQSAAHPGPALLPE